MEDPIQDWIDYGIGLSKKKEYLLTPQIHSIYCARICPIPLRWIEAFLCKPR